MKAALNIWDDFVTGKITAKQAYDQINESLVSANEAQKVQFIRLSEKILDREVPMTERNSDVEKAFWESTHGENEG